MKKIIYLLLLLPIVAIGQSTNQNFTKTVTYKEPSTTPIATPSSSQASIQVVYYDGLGRPIQQISNKQSASGKNIVTHIEYDNFGRQLKEYLPYKSESSSLDIETDALTSTLNYPDYLGQYPFSEKLMENSPLNTVVKQSAPGTSWAMGSGHEIKFKHQTNVDNEVKLYKAIATWNSSQALFSITLQNSSGGTYYSKNELYKTITFDENNLETSQNFTVEYKNKEGKVVLKRVNTSTEIFDTFYVYDQFGNLTYVIPPLVNTSNVISQTILDGLCYQYKYDKRNRLVEKKLPGKQWEFIVYNNLDQPVATGPTKNPINGGSNGWLITKYDVFGRVTHTGWYNGILPDAAGRFSYQNIMNGLSSSFEARLSGATPINGLDVSYTDKVYPQNSVNAYTLLTVNYYDDYLYSGAPNTSNIPSTIETQPVSTQLKGLPTGSWIRALQSGTIIGEKSYTLYDLKSRVIRTHKTNHLGGFTQVDTKLDFKGKTNYTIMTHKKTNSNILLKFKDTYTYTSQDRLLTHTHQINNDNIQLLTKNEYDELGKLVSKRVGGTDISGSTSLQKVDYDYNIRGWLTSINKVENLSQGSYPQDLFSFALSYDAITNGALFNGNIAETYWRTSSDNVLRKYTYQYDELNRLKNALYKKPDLTTPDTNSYNESVSYDKNGNILSLQRTGGYDDAIYNLTIDNLTYSYHSDKKNQLMKVSDASNNPNGFNDVINTGDDYSYDDYGNLKEDKNKDIIKIDYNHLNLPVNIHFGSGGKIEYLYSAVGTKLSKTVIVNGVFTVTEYQDGFQYANNVLEFFPHAEGYVKNTMVGDLKNFNYVFNYTDHLGNVRLSYGLDGTNGLKILEENNYYPFGLSHQNYNMSQRTYNKTGAGTVTICSTCPTGYKYKYNGKELQDELGLNWYDYGFRNYDVALGRWMNVDLFAEKYITTSPYAFVQNNPVSNREIDGRWFDKKNEGIAKKYENKINKKINKLNSQIAKLQKNSQDTGDLGERVAELQGSINDIASMRNAKKEDGGSEYRFGKADSKEDKASGGYGKGTYNTKGENGVVTMYVGDDVAASLHEIRHGGQDSRGEYSIDSGKGYGIAEEVSSFKVQYSYSGVFSYDSHNFDQGLSHTLNRALLNSEIIPPSARVNITNISGITPSMVNDIGTFYKSSAGNTVVPLYPPNNMTNTDFNNN